MAKQKAPILYLTDLYFKANGRNYYEEDIYLTSRLRDEFEILICHPLDSYRFEELVDVVVFRNTGPTIYYKEYFNEFVKRINQKHVPCFNPMTGKADTLGKQYMLDLTRQGFSVIPTIEDSHDIAQLPDQEQYMVKLKHGADSIGMNIVKRDELANLDWSDKIVQPLMNFVYEVSFYYINNQFQYALYAPDKSRRWELQQYQASTEDLNFAQQFIEWNALPHGIQRVDACRLPNGGLLLVELEDLNPYLSIDLLDDDVRERFVGNFKDAIWRVVEG